MKLTAQIERKLDHLFGVSKPWGEVRFSKKFVKRQKLRVERHRAKIDPECQPLYRRYSGWDW